MWFIGSRIARVPAALPAANPRLAITIGAHGRPCRLVPPDALSPAAQHPASLIARVRAHVAIIATTNPRAANAAQQPNQRSTNVKG